MTNEYIPFGNVFLDISPDNLAQPISKQMLLVCTTHSDFEVLELRYLKSEDGTISDIIVVDCVNDQVPSRNAIGIKVRERLALVFSPDKAPEVRALRKDFPGTIPHLNYVGIGEPVSLCIYFEPWSTVERTWTPQQFLRRILWWLSKTAKGILHREDQPLEQLYFNSSLEIVLPTDFESKIKDPELSLICHSVVRSDGSIRVIRGAFLPKAKSSKHSILHTEVLMLELPPVIHGAVEHYPKTLGELHDQLSFRGAEFIKKLRNIIQEIADGKSLRHDPQGRCLLIFIIPVKRAADLEPELIEVRAFFLVKDITKLGQSVGILNEINGDFYAVPIIGKDEGDIKAWHEIEIVPLEVKYEPDKLFARKASGIDMATADFKGVLFGVGALGSSLAEFWSKGGWGTWTYVDSDTIEPHNIVRHLVKNFQIGQFKTDAVKYIVEANYHPSHYGVSAIADNALNRSNTKITDAISTAEILVDATTTVEVPREMSQRDIPRSASVFLTPSGNNSVLLLESADRSMRLDSLEAQYYRGIINSDWGADHLTGHHGALWVGAGCRDVSAIISYESIQLHAAILSKQIRFLRDKPEPYLRIWSAQPETGALVSEEIPVYEKIQCICREWRVMWDAGLNQKLCSIRNAHLPNETGGILLGYIDQKLKSLYIVDALSAPPDSDSDLTGFTRGVQGLDSALKNIANRTANIVGYIGEWHSHPSFTSAFPSDLDRELIRILADTLSLDGQPALMIIVGSAGEMSVSMKEE